MYERGEATTAEIVDRHERGFGWLAHPDEGGRRTSHAVACEDGVWLFDPLDAAGIHDEIEALAATWSEAGTSGAETNDAETNDAKTNVAGNGERDEPSDAVAGVAVLSDYHARDADVFAERYDVPVTIPDWLSRVESRVDARVERISAESTTDREAANLPGTAFELTRVDPGPGWSETVAYRASDGTLYTPDLLTREGAVGAERIALTIFQRWSPPRDLFAGLDPSRILSGHGEGVHEDAAGALRTALEGARRRLPRALVAHGPRYVRGVLGAVIE
jgi:hypothetical protein